MPVQAEYHNIDRNKIAIIPAEQHHLPSISSCPLNNAADETLAKTRRVQFYRHITWKWWPRYNDFSFIDISPGRGGLDTLISV
jgi:hypothetical protein